MGALRVFTYPLQYGFRGFGATYRNSKRLAQFYDIAKRIVAELGVRGNKTFHYKTLGNALEEQVSANSNIALDNATLVGSREAIISAVMDTLPGYIQPATNSTTIASILQKQGIIKTPGKSKRRTFFPIKQARAWSTIVDGLVKHRKNLASLEKRLQELEARFEADTKKLLSEIERQYLGEKGYQEIMDALYRSDPNKDLTGNIIDMLDTITKWAWQRIGKSDHSEAAGWLAIQREILSAKEVDGGKKPEERIGYKYKYVLPQENLDLENTEVHTLKKAGTKGAIITTPENTEATEINDERGNYLTANEWQNLNVRVGNKWKRFNVSDEYVIVQKQDGSRQLFRRVYKSGYDVSRRDLREGKLLGSGAAALISTIGSSKNACVEIEPVEEPHKIVFRNNEVIPFINEGSLIELKSAGSRNKNLRDEKIAKGRKYQRLLGIPITSQTLEASVGNVRASAVMPLAKMIFDVKNFFLRPQNQFLINIVGVRSYFIRSLIEFNSEGEAICLGSLEVTNPEILSSQISKEESQDLLKRFKRGKTFARMASTGIMIKTLREEFDRIHSRYLDPQVIEVMKARDYRKLEATRVDDASILFADISGFTSLSAKLKDDPGEVVDMLNTAFEILSPYVHKNGGIIDKFIGDCIMANFGVLKRSPQDTESALITAIDFQTELQALNNSETMQKSYKKNGIEPMGISVGINTGAVIAGNIGPSEGKNDYTVIGDTVNVAQRIQSAAKRGRISIGVSTFNALSADFKRKLVDDFNAYNRDLDGLRKFIMEERPDLSAEEVKAKLARYELIYKDATMDDIFVPGVAWAKNKGAVPFYYVRWDKHAWRYQFLKKAGIEIEGKSLFENPPPAPVEIIASIEKEPAENRQALLDAYRSLQS